MDVITNDIINMSHLNLGELQRMIRSKHGVNMTTKKLSSISRLHGIRRRREGPMSDREREDLQTAVETELQSMPQSCGYRLMHAHLKRTKGLHYPRDEVMRAMKRANPEAADERRGRSITRRNYRVPGPDFMWHLDGYDKLKKYGLCIHGCIDGFSRKVIWLEVGPTNNNPDVVGKFFLDAVRAANGTPNTIRADRGTENVTIERIQKALRDAPNSFLYGRSCLNQRIERFWRSLRDGCGQFIMDYLGNMEQQGIFSTANPLHLEAVRFCFVGVVRRQLANFVNYWNHHTIRKSVSNTMSGKPVVLYETYEKYRKPLVCDVMAQAERTVYAVDDVCTNFWDAAEIILCDWEDQGAESTRAQYDNAARKMQYLITEINRNT